ncbi:MAG TPA: TlpA disulfide reductase family protein [Prolixibacteraceae bacterium]|nr:TlpA disulfide reductase family protein [Prolixibacteraceae bacterium]
MKRKILFLLMISFVAIVSCSEKAVDGDPTVNVENLQKDFTKWWSYYNQQINLSSEFTAIDHSSNEIGKERFLNELTTGKYIPVELISNDTSKTIYKLFPINQQSAKDIATAIKNASVVEYEHFKMEGQKFPGFSFTDLNGRSYTNENTIGKVVVLKCWYINCVACVAEFPELNELVNQYKNRDDIVFVSLAFNDKEDLKAFLLKKPFNYATVPDQKSYLKDTLKVHMYPTHFIIDRNGIIIKVVNKAVRLNSVLANAMKADLPI